MKAIINFIKDDQGETAVEYGIMIAAIAAVIVAVVYAIGVKTKTGFDAVNANMK